MQRLRVALTGLVAVVLLIGVASVILSAVDRRAPADAGSAVNPDTVANLSDSAAPLAEAAVVEEPLAELGLAPSKQGGDTVNVTVAEQPPNPGAPEN